jgi:thioredoxin
MISLTDENFEETLQKEKKMVLVDFWAPWCQPCFLLAPILEKVAKDFKDKFILAKVNLEEAQAITQKLKIEQIPTVVLFKKGKPINGFIGARPEPFLREVLQKMIKEAEEKEGGAKMEDEIRNYQEYAEKNGFKLNPDREAVTRLVKGLLENEKKYGIRYCPCRRITGNPEEDRPKICPCKWHRQEIEKDGHCLCELFFK